MKILFLTCFFVSALCEEFSVDKFKENLVAMLDENDDHSCVMKKFSDNQFPELYLAGLANHYNKSTDINKFAAIVRESTQFYLIHIRLICRNGINEDKMRAKLADIQSCYSRASNELKLIDQQIDDFHQNNSKENFTNSISDLQTMRNEKFNEMLRCTDEDVISANFAYFRVTTREDDHDEKCLAEHFVRNGNINLKDYNETVELKGSLHCEETLKKLDEVLESRDMLKKIDSNLLFGLPSEGVWSCVLDEFADKKIMFNLVKIQVISTFNLNDDQMIELRMRFNTMMMSFFESYLTCPHLLLENKNILQ